MSTMWPFVDEKPVIMMRLFMIGELLFLSLLLVAMLLFAR